MARTRAYVRDGVLVSQVGGRDRVIQVGSSEWESWLEQPGTQLFHFEDGTITFAARRELQGGHWYWYAYRRRGGRLRKAYLGRAADLTLERLTEAGARLRASEDAPSLPGDAETASPPTTPAPDRHDLPDQASTALGGQREAGELPEEAGDRAPEIREATPLVSRLADRWLLLTRREREVAQLAAQGLTSRQIAQALVIAEKTAANHLQRVLDKLDLDSRTQLAARAVEIGLEDLRHAARQD